MNSSLSNFNQIGLKFSDSWFNKYSHSIGQFSIILVSATQSISIVNLLCEKCRYFEISWSAFTRIRTEYRSKCGKTRTKKIPNADTFHAVFVTHIHFACCNLSSSGLNSNSVVFCDKLEIQFTFLLVFI